MAKVTKKPEKKGFSLSDLWNYLTNPRKKAGKAVKPGAKPYTKSPEELLEDAIKKVKEFHDQKRDYRQTHMNNLYIALFSLGGRLSYFKPAERANYYKKVGHIIEEIAKEDDVSFFGMIGRYKAQLEPRIPEVYSIPPKPSEKDYSTTKKPGEKPGKK